MDRQKIDTKKFMEIVCNLIQPKVFKAWSFVQ